MVGIQDVRKKYDSVTLADYVSQNSSEENLRSVFLKMDITLQYIHEHGYCVEIFYPTEILVLINSNDLTKEIIFKKLMKLPISDDARGQLIKEDILKSSLVQIGTYVYSSGLQSGYPNILNRFTPTSVKENFDSIEKFLPLDDVSYYRGVIRGGIYNYLNQYIKRKKEFESKNIEEQSGSSSSSKQLRLISSNRLGVEPVDSSVNEWNYRQINGLKDDAFIHILLIPSFALGVLLLFGLIAWVFSMLSI